MVPRLWAIILRGYKTADGISTLSISGEVNHAESIRKETFEYIDARVPGS